jgi:membrane-associated phospholipid phosphatase
MLVIATRSVVLITLACIDVVLTAVVVVATGNHYPLDLVAGAVLVAVSVPVTGPWSPALRGRTIAKLGRLGNRLRAKAILTDD